MEYKDISHSFSGRQSLTNIIEDKLKSIFIEDEIELIKFGEEFYTAKHLVLKGFLIN